MRRLNQRALVANPLLRFFSSEHKEIVVPNAAPKAPMASFEPVVPMDFNPHIDWFEYPMEVFDGYYPHTRDERIAGHEFNATHTHEEIAQKYGIRYFKPHKISSLLAYLVASFYPVYFMWSMYRSWGLENTYYEAVQIMQAEGVHVDVEDDELFLDVWLGLGHKIRQSPNDFFTTWKPAVKKGGAKTKWFIPFEHKDVSEFRHLLSKN